MYCRNGSSSTKIKLKYKLKISQPLPLHDKFIKLYYICSIKNSLANLLKVLKSLQFLI